MNTADRLGFRSDSDRTTGVPDSNDAPKSFSSKQDDASLGEVIEFVKSYAKQETIDPLKGAGRWLGFGVAAAFALGLGLMLVLLGALRVAQTELDSLRGGSWTWVPYAITLVVTLILLAFTILRIKKSTLNNEPK